MKKTISLLLVFAMLIACLGAVNFASAKVEFTDIDKNDYAWAYEHIMNMADKGIINGTGDGRFEPDNPILREEFAKIIDLGFDFEDKGIKIDFKDVKNEWYKEYVDDIVSKGIMKGDSADMFGVGKAMLRCDIALTIARFSHEDSELAIYEKYLPSGTDSDKIPSYAKGAMGYCYFKNILTGDEEGFLNPEKTATRAEIAKMIDVYMESMKQPEQTPEETPEQTPEKKPYPVASGDFIQPGLCADWGIRNWRAHFMDLKEAGIDTFIIQWIGNSPNGVIGETYYESDLPDYKKGADYDASSPRRKMLEYCLTAAEEYGISVYVGLNAADEWWQKGVLDRDWYTMQSRIGNAMAEEIYKKYYRDFPNALKGFYWWFEMNNYMWNMEASYADMLNINLDFLTTLDPKMKMVLSPYMTTNVSAVQTGKAWTKFFANARFRKGDIFTIQDSVGAGGMVMEQLDTYMQQMAKAVATCPNVEFWANNENFIQATWSSAPLSRFVEQMKITDKYVQKHITFSYSHYYSTVGARDGGLMQKAYVHYYETGELPE